MFLIYNEITVIRIIGINIFNTKIRFPTDNAVETPINIMNIKVHIYASRKNGLIKIGATFRAY